MYIYNGLKIKDTILINNVQYPLNWWGQHSDADNLLLGVTQVPDPTTPDPNLYTWTENLDGSLNIVAKTSTELAAQLSLWQDMVWSNIKDFRDKKTQSGVYVSSFSKWIHTDTYSRTQWLGMLMAGASLPAIQWKTMDGTFITTTPQLAQAVFSAVMTQDATIFGAAESKKQAMLSLSDPRNYYFGADLLPQDTSQGWPATYI